MGDCEFTRATTSDGCQVGKRPAQATGNTATFHAYAEQRRTVVWSPPLMHLISGFPRLQDTNIGQLEHDLGYTFANSMYLAEALTHASLGHGQTMHENDKCLTPDCQRLAFVGSAVAEELVARLLHGLRSFQRQQHCHRAKTPQQPLLQLVERCRVARLRTSDHCTRMTPTWMKFPAALVRRI